MGIMGESEVATVIRICILILVLFALISPIIIPMGKTKSSFVVLFGSVLAAIWIYHIYLTYLPNYGGYGLGTSIWMFVALTALYLVFVAVISLIHWPSSRED
jgi:predicted ABC-type exoprotein transport system permease subunit